MIDIKDNPSLRAMCEDMAAQPFVVMDTEFIRERTYYPVLALVQVAWEGQEPLLIDPLEITDWQPFHDVLLNTRVVKVFHAGRQDLEIFYYQMNAMPANVFDTQVAASMCGLGDQLGYGVLVAKLLGVQLAKGSSYTNWLQRPLTGTQLRYARDDVHYLSAVYKKLVDMAQAKQRLQWIQEELLQQLNEELFTQDPAELWRKVKKAKSLKERDLPVLQEMAIWRDTMARKINKPVRFLLSDEAIIELARIDQLSLENLKSRRGLTAGIVNRYGEEILRRHSEGRSAPKAKWPRNEKQRRPPSEKSEAMADLAWLLIKEIADNAHLAPIHLIAKKDLPYFIDAYVRGKDLSDFPISHGWRKATVGDLLVKLIEGKLTIKVQNRQIVWLEDPN